MYPKIALSWLEITQECRARTDRVRTGLQARHLFTVNRMDVLLANAHDWRNILAAKSKQQKDDNFQRAAFKGFFNYDLTADEKALAKEFLKNDAEIALSIENAISAGFKLSVSANKANDTIIASMTAVDSTLPQAGFTMSAHARHWYDALGVLMFKHYKVLGQKWNPSEVQATDDIG